MNYIKTAIRCAQEGGGVALDGFGRAKKIRRKSPNQLATEFDVLAEKKIREIIKKEYPEHSVFGEELGKEGRGEYVWLIDPIDGTHNFIHGIPLFATSVALAKNRVVLCGAIHAPFSGETFWAGNGKGAWLNGSRIWCSNKDNPDECMLLHGTNFRLSPKMAKAFPYIAKRFRHVRMLGSAALYLAYVAAGRADIALDFGIRPYDIAAGCLIAQEAGCRITDFRGEEWSYNSSGIICSNKNLYPKMLKIVQESLCRQ